MKKILATTIIVAVILYFGNQLAATQIQAKAQEAPQVQQNFHEVYGKIKQANGNEIVVAIGNLPTSGRSGMGMDSANAMPAGEASERPSPAARPNMQTSDSEQAPRGSRGAGSATRGSMTMTSTSLELTGEEKTFLIPVTAQITTGSGENERTVRFTQLAYKNTVKLSLNEKGDVVAVSVLS